VTGDLVAFLRERYDDDEAAARATAWSPNTMTHNPWEARPPQRGEDGWTVWSQGQYLKFTGLAAAPAFTPSKG